MDVLCRSSSVKLYSSNLSPNKQWENENSTLPVGFSDFPLYRLFLNVGLLFRSLELSVSSSKLQL